MPWDWKGNPPCFMQLWKKYKEVFGHAIHTLRSCSLCNNLGFLQKNNNLDEKSRIVASLNEPPSPQKLGLRDSHFRHTETDFSNLYARGERVHLLFPAFVKVNKPEQMYRQLCFRTLFLCVFMLYVFLGIPSFYLHTDDRIVLLLL